MNEKKVSEELFQFIQNSPSMFHSIQTMKSYLDEADFTYLPENTTWNLEKGKNYYTIRNHSSIIPDWIFFRQLSFPDVCVP